MKLSSKRNILQLVSLMKAHNIKNVVLCPGSRNAPIVQTVVESGQFECYSITDERSAGFFAIGISDATQSPTAICCTSGSALLNIAPSVSEAYYRNIPLLIISADRPESWIGQMDGQTMHQNGSLSNIVKKSIQLIEPKDKDDCWYCNRLINEGLLALTSDLHGPVHINIPISEPLFDFSSESLPEERTIKIGNVKDKSPNIENEELKQILQNSKRILVITGQTPYDKQGVAHELINISEATKAVVLAENLANTNFINNADQIIYAYSSDEELRPDLVITIGGHIVSKRLKNFIRTNQPKHHWHFGSTQNVIDIFKCVDVIFPQCTIDNLLSDIHKIKSGEKGSTLPDNAFYSKWHTYSKKIKEPFQDTDPKTLSTIASIKVLLDNELPNATIHVANSSAVRAFMLFHNQKECYCNRGINGIDGSLSTAMGFAAARAQAGNRNPNFLIIGDLSFFYDQNGLWNKYHKGNLRILLLNNGCGEIFHHLPGLEQAGCRDEFVAAQHKTTAEGIALQNNCKYLCAKTIDELKDQMKTFTSGQYDKTIILEVIIDPAADEQVQKDYYESLKQR